MYALHRLVYSTVYTVLFCFILLELWTVSNSVYLVFVSNRDAIFIWLWWDVFVNFGLTIKLFLFGWTKKNWLERDLNRDLRIDVPGLYQLSYLALHWRSPYFVNIFVRGRQSEVMKP